METSNNVDAPPTPLGTPGHLKHSRRDDCALQPAQKKKRKDTPANTGLSVEPSESNDCYSNINNRGGDTNNAVSEFELIMNHPFKLLPCMMNLYHYIWLLVNMHFVEPHQGALQYPTECSFFLTFNVDSLSILNGPHPFRSLSDNVPAVECTMNVRMNLYAYLEEFGILADGFKGADPLFVIVMSEGQLDQHSSVLTKLSDLNRVRIIRKCKGYSLAADLVIVTNEATLTWNATWMANLEQLHLGQLTSGMAGVRLSDDSLDMPSEGGNPEHIKASDYIDTDGDMNGSSSSSNNSQREEAAFATAVPRLCAIYMPLFIHDIWMHWMILLQNGPILNPAFRSEYTEETTEYIRNVLLAGRGLEVSQYCTFGDSTNRKMANGTTSSTSSGCDIVRKYTPEEHGLIDMLVARLEKHCHHRKQHPPPEEDEESVTRTKDVDTKHAANPSVVSGTTTTPSPPPPPITIGDRLSSGQLMDLFGFAFMSRVYLGYRKAQQPQETLDPNDSLGETNQGIMEECSVTQSVCNSNTQIIESPVDADGVLKPWLRYTVLNNAVCYIEF